MDPVSFTTLCALRVSHNSQYTKLKIDFRIPTVGVILNRKPTTGTGTFFTEPPPFLDNIKVENGQVQYPYTIEGLGTINTLKQI